MRAIYQNYEKWQGPALVVKYMPLVCSLLCLKPIHLIATLLKIPSKRQNLERMKGSNEQIPTRKRKTH